MKLPSPLLLLLLVLSVISTGTVADPNEDTKAINDFAFNLLRAMKAKKTIVLPTSSIWKSLASLVDVEGVVEKQVKKVLGINDKEKLKEAEKHLRNRLNTSDTIKHSVDQIVMRNGIVSSLVDKASESILKFLDFSISSMASYAINTLIGMAIGRSRMALVDAEAITPTTKLGIVQTTKVEAVWHQRFDPSLTNPSKFISENSSQIVMMMKNPKIMAKSCLAPEIKAHILQLDLSSKTKDKMTFVLPAVKGAAGFEATLKSLTYETFKTATDHLKKNYHEVLIPKVNYQFIFSDELIEALKELGMMDSFGPRNSTNNDLHIDFIRSHIDMTVDEKGVDANATSRSSFPLDKISKLSFNRPYMFLIQQDHDILFAGLYLTPLQ